MKRLISTVLCLLALYAMFLLMLAPLDDAWASGGLSPERQTIPYTRTPRPTATHTAIPPTATRQPNATPTIADGGIRPTQAPATSTGTAAAPAASTSAATPGTVSTASPGKSETATPLPGSTATRSADPTGARASPSVIPPAQTDATVRPLPVAAIDTGVTPGAGTFVFCCGGIVGLALMTLGLLLKGRRADASVRQAG